MPLSALVNGEERIAPLLPDMEWQVIRDFAASGAIKVTTTCCHSPATPVSVKGGYRYFKAPGCPHFKDTTDTLVIETALIRGITSAGWKVRCNVVGGGTHAWALNILASSPTTQDRVGFVLVPNEPSVGTLGEYVTIATRAADAGIAVIFLFPSIPRDGMWQYVQAGKLITAVKYVPGQAIVAGLDAALFAEVALKTSPVVRVGKIRSFRVTTHARPARTDGTETVTHGGGKPLTADEFVVGFSVSYMNELLVAEEWGWGVNPDVSRLLAERNEPMDELLLLSAEMSAMHVVISHFAGAGGRFFHARDIASGLVIETSGSARINAIVDDFLRGGFQEKYATVYPRFVYVVKRDLLDMKRAKGYIIARSTTSR